MRLSTRNKMDAAVSMIRGGYKIKHVCKALNLSEATYRKYLCEYVNLTYKTVHGK